jgi:L-amino acid N-acyltransferase YncA
MRQEDWPAVSAIYEHGIAGRQATFETDVPDWDAWSRSHLADHRLVAVEDELVVGWAALAPVSQRECYSGVAENSVYVESRAQGPRYRTGPARAASRRRRSRGYLDDQGRGLPGERGQCRAPSRLWVPRSPHQ